MPLVRRTRATLRRAEFGFLGVMAPSGTAALTKMGGIPLYIAQAERDETIPSAVGKQAAETVRLAGSDVTLKIYTDEEMEAAGAVHGSEQTYSFHHADLALLEDDAYAEWLFSHVRKAK